MTTIKLYGFARTVDAEEVTKFLEEITGEGTVLALMARPPKEQGSRASVVVQFTSSEFAEDISSMAHRRDLWFEGSYLKVRRGMHDITSKLQSAESKLENTILHIGCLVSDDKFFCLWSLTDVKVNFGLLRKLQFFSSYDGYEYKLELSYESIREVQLHHQSGQATKFLLIQVFTSFMNSISFICLSFYLYAEKMLPF